MDHPEGAAAASELQFEQAEYVAREARSCSGCNAAIQSQYFVLNGKTLCTRCHGALQAALAEGSPGARFFAALGWGGGGALLGAAIYYGIREATGYELGLVAIAVGILVGKGVARGARGRGGGGYQLMAVLLTYFSIVLTYLPEMFRAWEQHTPSGSVVGELFVAVLMGGLALFAPFVIGFKAPLSLVITGIALYEAWKVTRRAPLVITGPHALAADPAAPAPAATPPPAPAADGG